MYIFLLCRNIVNIYKYSLYSKTEFMWPCYIRANRNINKVSELFLETYLWRSDKMASDWKLKLLLYIVPIGENARVFWASSICVPLLYLLLKSWIKHSNLIYYLLPISHAYLIWSKKPSKFKFTIESYWLYYIPESAFWLGSFYNNNIKVNIFIES